MAAISLYHLSDIAGISRFDPRPAPSAGIDITEPVVWAIDEVHLHNYLLPRDCPRVTFYPRPDSDPAHVERLMAGSLARAVVAVEAGWLEAIRSAQLILYTLPAETFEQIDAGAGYFVSREPVVPSKEEIIDDLLAALLERNVELRITPTLWPMRDIVLDSTLHFSIIRFRNAAPPPAGFTLKHP